MTNVLLKVNGLSKNYALTKALDNVSFEIMRGEIHALCGENGAGKSTFIKLLTGAEEPSSGIIEFEGNNYKKLTPNQSFNLGITAIYQEFSLIPYLTVTENIFFGREISRHGIRNIKKMNDEAKRLCDEMGVCLDIKARVCDLGVAQQQIIEILKAVSKKSKFIIMDEPTAPLTLSETDVFFKIIRKLRDNNTTILFISHKLEEVFDICDRVTVFCDGKYIVTKDINDINRKQLIYYMVGREIADTYPAPASSHGEIVLKVNNVSNHHIKDVSFELKRGEILGFGGLVGAGRTELVRLIFGADKMLSGSMELFGKKYVPDSPHAALQAGIGLIPEDRKNQGIIRDLSVNENIVFASLIGFAKSGVINAKKMEDCTRGYINELRIATPNLRQKVKLLSGGNQQKVVLAKILATNCEILIFDEPTRGIDVGAKQEIYKLMCQLIDAGKSIIMVSSEMPELIGMSDRIIVMSNGRIAGIVDKAEFSQERLLEIASIKMSRGSSDEE